MTRSSTGNEAQHDNNSQQGRIRIIRFDRHVLLILNRQPRGLDHAGCMGRLHIVVALGLSASKIRKALLSLFYEAYCRFVPAPVKE